MQIYDGETWADFFVEKYIHETGINRIVQATVEADFGEGIQEMSRIRIEWADISTSDEPEEMLGRFSLRGNTPNPFASSTEIVFQLSEPQHIRLAVYDLLGREVDVLDEGYRPAGEHRLRWNAADRSSGIYLYRLQAGAHSDTRRMVLVK